MAHLRETNRCNNVALAAVLAIIGSSEGVLANPPSHTGSLSLCRDLAGHSTPDGSVWLEGEEKGEVVCVVDGDTFDVRLDRTRQIVRARIWGVDCPESSANEKCTQKGTAACAAENVAGKRATRETQAILSANRRVTLEPPYKRNGNRKLTYVRLRDGIDLGRKLIEKCLCVAGYQHARKAEYEKVARACGKRGK